MSHPKKSALGETVPLVPPIYQSSVYTIPDLDALDAIMNDGAPGFIYARDSHPNARRLAQLLAETEGSEWGVVTGSGMAAISAIVLATVKQGQRILASNRLYGRTVQLFTQELSHFGVTTDYVDANDLGAVEHGLTARPSPSGRGVGGEGPRIFFVETISNPLLRVVDIAVLADMAHAHGCLLVVDNTFATPILTRPMELGADFVMESLTKMIAGHSDVTLGFVGGNDAEMLTAINTAVSIWGLASNPFDCWLAERGLATLDLRMRAACKNAEQLADWLAEQPTVTRVYYPSRHDHPDREVSKRILDRGFGHMLCFELEGGRDAVNRFMQRAPGIPFSPSLGHSTTTLSHPATTSHRYVSAAEKQRQGITDGLIRLSVGVESPAYIQAELAKGVA